MLKSLLITDWTFAVKNSYLPSPRCTLWVSTVDPEDLPELQKMHQRLSKKATEHFYQLFYDWSDEDKDPYIQSHLEGSGPQKHHIENLIGFLKPRIESPTDHHLGINCFAGVSRSTAVGIIALCLAGRSPKEALQETLSLRPQAWPNLRILRLGSEILHLNLTDPVKNWKLSEQKRLFTPPSQ